MTEAEARARLASMLAASEEPRLDQTEIDDLIALARIAAPPTYATAPAIVPPQYPYNVPTFQPRLVQPDRYAAWTPSTTYAVGKLLAPPTRNGHFYKVTTGGSSGVTEPTWPTVSGATVTVNGVTYAEAGLAPWPGAWNLKLAAAEGWRRKAAKAAGNYKFTADGNTLTREQIFKHCLEMARRYGASLSSLSLGSGDVRRHSLVPGVETNWD